MKSFWLIQFRLLLVGAALLYVFFTIHRQRQEQRPFRPPMKVYKERLFHA